MPSEWYAVSCLSAVAVVTLLATSEILFQIHRKYKILQLQMTDYLEIYYSLNLKRNTSILKRRKSTKNEYFEEEEEQEQQDEAAASLEDLKLFEEFVEEYLAD